MNDRCYEDTDKALLGTLLEPAAAGAYMAGYRIVGRDLSPIAAVLAAANARIFKAGMRRLQGLVGQFRGWFAALSAVSMVVSVVLWFDADAEIWMLDAFGDSARLLQWLGALPLLLTIRHLLGNVLAGRGRVLAVCFGLVLARHEKGSTQT